MTEISTRFLSGDRLVNSLIGLGAAYGAAWFKAWDLLSENGKTGGVAAIRDAAADVIGFTGIGMAFILGALGLLALVDTKRATSALGGAVRKTGWAVVVLCGIALIGGLLMCVAAAQGVAG